MIALSARTTREYHAMSCAAQPQSPGQDFGSPMLETSGNSKEIHKQDGESHKFKVTHNNVCYMYPGAAEGIAASSATLISA